MNSLTLYMKINWKQPPLSTSSLQSLFHNSFIEAILLCSLELSWNKSTSISWNLTRRLTFWNARRCSCPGGCLLLVVLGCVLFSLPACWWRDNHHRLHLHKYSHQCWISSSGKWYGEDSAGVIIAPIRLWALKVCSSVQAIKRAKLLVENSLTGQTE